MPVEFKDYYSVLGVARTASADEIKTAFRKLARVYHPDIAKDKKTAEEKFKEINEAYEVLGDPEKRRKYDELGANWQAGEGMPPPRRPAGAWNFPGEAEEQEFHFGGTGFSDFFEQFFGRRSPGGARGFSFAEDDFGTEAFPRARDSARGRDIEGDLLVTLDEAMHGSLREISLQQVERSTGGVHTETFKVRIPPGAQEGRRIRVPGKGGEGAAGGPRGDLFLRVRLAAHPDFRVRGSDLLHDLTLAPWEAALGAQVTVPTLSSAIKLRVPPGTSSGRQLRVRGQGLPQGTSGQRGDLYVIVGIHVPEEIGAEARELWEKLAKVSRFDPRAAES